MKSQVAKRTELFQESVIRQMTRVCQQYKAINLAQEGRIGCGAGIELLSSSPGRPG